MTASNTSHNVKHSDRSGIVTGNVGEGRPQLHKISLDLLRALAILLVLGRHSFTDGLWRWIGWSGVDLFFVLSGFLVSGLIFQEVQTRSDVRLGRFLVRRALKIYPSFYLFLMVSVLASWMAGKQVEISQLLSEIFYVQSYFDGLWMHTWSLAVEEHFYLIFALAVAFWQRKGLPIRTGVTMKWLGGILLFWVAIRCGYCWSHRFETSFDFTATHMRADGIWLGVILSFSYHFGSLQQWIVLRKGAFGLSFAIAVAMLLLFPAGSFVMNSVGILVVALGYGGLLCLGLGLENRFGSIMKDGGLDARVLRILSGLGRHSYSIYLWHLLADNLLMKAGIYTTLGWEYGGTAAGLITIVFAIILGITMGTLIELPVLRWRNRILE